MGPRKQWCKSVESHHKTLKINNNICICIEGKNGEFNPDEVRQIPFSSYSLSEFTHQMARKKHFTKKNGKLITTCIQAHCN